jgi:hypothetical protein
MAQGPWDTGTWDSALWDSLPVTGNAATGGVGGVDNAASVPIVGVESHGQTGSLAQSVSISISGVQASGQVGSENETNEAAVSGVTAYANVGYVGNSITLSLSGVSATGNVGNVIYSPSVVVIDTHDGDHKRRRRFEEEVAQRDRRKQQLIAIYEDLLEAKPEVAEQIADEFIESDANYLQPRINFDKLLENISAVERLYREHQELDDEDVLLLL